MKSLIEEKLNQDLANPWLNCGCGHGRTNPAPHAEGCPVRILEKAEQAGLVKPDEEGHKS